MLYKIIQSPLKLSTRRISLKYVFVFLQMHVKIMYVIIVLVPRHVSWNLHRLQGVVAICILKSFLKQNCH